MRETVLCGDCDGFRDDEGLPCPTCGGTGEVRVELVTTEEDMTEIDDERS